MNNAITETRRNEILRTGTFNYNRRSFRATSWRGGHIEVYRVRRDGLEIFVGYLIDLATADAEFCGLAYDAVYGEAL